MENSEKMGFADRLILSTRALGHCLCVGLDPFADKIPPIFGPKGDVATLEAFFNAVIDALAGKVAVVKPQIGLFEPFGIKAIGLVARLSARAQQKGLIVLLDAKRGDIGTTATGYAAASLGEGSVFGADCVTVNPYMGLDTLVPFVERAKATQTGLSVLVRTSNPGAKDFQDLLVDGKPLWQHVATKLAPIAEELKNPETGFSSLMVVMGATWPEEAAQLRAILPNVLFLVPGYGAQGASATEAMAGFVMGAGGTPMRNQKEGGVVSSSRGVLYPDGAFDAENIEEWRAIFDANLAKTVDEISAAAKN